MHYQSLIEEESGKKSQKLYYKTDIEIAQETAMTHIREIAAGLGIDEKYVEQYGSHKAKKTANCSLIWRINRTANWFW